MIQLCQYLTDRGQCDIKSKLDAGESTCPAIRLTIGYSRISEINYSLMQQMACSDRWREAREEMRDSEYISSLKLPTLAEVEQDLKEHTCIECGHVDTQDEETFYPVGEGYLCEMCYQTIGAINREAEKVEPEQAPVTGGTHPDPETHHCQECGLIYSHEDWCFEYGTCKKCAEHLDFKELKEMVAEAKKAEPSVCEEKNEIQFTQIFGNVWAAISGESVHLKYGNSKCGIWDRTIFDTLLEMTEEERRKEIDELVKGMASKQQRKACLRQFTIALEKGEVSFPEVA